MEKLEKHGTLWSRDELILALDLYCRIPFKKTKANNPLVIELANAIGRTPASVARKLGNFGSFDPQLKKREISGLSHTSELDKEIWEQYSSDWSQLIHKASRLRRSGDYAGGTGNQYSANIVPPKGPSEKQATQKVRLHQQFFRDAVLSSYNGTCCVTGLGVMECLVASHIIPWALDSTRRVDPTNGLCLSATFDCLFDSGLVTISTSLQVVISRKLLKRREKEIQESICAYHKRPIIMPSRFLPARDCLEWHNNNVFQ